MAFVQIHASLLCAAALIAYLTARGSWPMMVLVFGACFIGTEGVVNLLLGRRRQSLRREANDFERAVNSRTLDQARSAAFEALSEAKRCRPTARSGSESLMGLPISLREVFGKYDRVVFTSGDLLELGSRDGGFIHVGSTFDGGKLLVRDSDGVLFEWDRPGLPDNDARPEYPSLFHWIALSTEE